MLVSVVVLVAEDGLDPLVLLLLLELVAGEELVLLVLLVLELLLLFSAGFTTVVVFSVLVAGEPLAGVTVSDFCSHAASSAALAKMQMVFFIDI